VGGYYLGPCVPCCSPDSNSMHNPTIRLHQTRGTPPRPAGIDSTGTSESRGHSLVATRLSILISCRRLDINQRSSCLVTNHHSQNRSAATAAIQTSPTPPTRDARRPIEASKRIAVPTKVPSPISASQSCTPNCWWRNPPDLKTRMAFSLSGRHGIATPFQVVNTGFRTGESTPCSHDVAGRAERDGSVRCLGRSQSTCEKGSELLDRFMSSDCWAETRFLGL
jgi:hypothetical protein